MDNYWKGENVELEEELSMANIPINSLPQNFGWLLVKGATKVEKVTSYAINNIESDGAMVIAGSGAAVQKVATIFLKTKASMKKVFYVVKFTYRTIQEFWEPKLAGLERLVVTRQIPTVHVLLSKSDLDVEEPGYMSVAGITPPPHMWPQTNRKSANRSNNRRRSNNNSNNNNNNKQQQRIGDTHHEKGIKSSGPSSSHDGGNKSSGSGAHNRRRSGQPKHEKNAANTAAPNVPKDGSQKQTPATTNQL